MAQADALAVQAAADLVLYQAGFADGVASVQSPSGDVTAAQEQIDIAAALKPLQDQIAALSLAKQQEDALLVSVQSAIASLQGLFAPQVPPAA